MSIKAILFCLIGIGLSMSATAHFMNQDLQRLAAAQKEKAAAEGGMAAQGGGAGGSASQLPVTRLLSAGSDAMLACAARNRSYTDCLDVVPAGVTLDTATQSGYRLTARAGEVSYHVSVTDGETCRWTSADPSVCDGW